MGLLSIHSSFLEPLRKFLSKRIVNLEQRYQLDYSCCTLWNLRWNHSFHCIHLVSLFFSPGYKLFPRLNMLLRAYNLITKRITGSLYMMLEKPSKDQKYLVKYYIFGFTLQNSSVFHVKITYHGITSHYLQPVKLLYLSFGHSLPNKIYLSFWWTRHIGD